MTNLPYRYPNFSLYVSTTGNDSTGDGTSSNPWATPGKAISAIRTGNLNLVQNQDINVYVRAGTYAISSPLAHTVADTACNGHRIIWKSIDGIGAAVFDGTVAVNGWAVYSGSIYRTAVSSSLNFWTLYENGIRAKMARTPAWSPGVGFPCALAPYYISTDLSLGQVSANNQTLGYSTSDISPGSWTVADIQACAWSGGYWQWTVDTTPITSVDTVNHKFGLNSLMKFNLYNTAATPNLGSRYFIQGDLSFLVGGGQWYYDRNDTHGSPGAGQHYLYYWARDGAIASQDIRVPVVTEIVSFTGTSQYDRITGITFDGFVFKGTDFLQTYRWGFPQTAAAQASIVPIPGENHIDAQWSYFSTYPTARTAAVHLKHADNIIVQNCHIYNTGMSGLYGEGYVQSCTFQNLWIEKIGATGMALEGMSPGEGDINGSNTLFNLKINNIGEMTGDGSGLDLSQSSNNTVSHLYIHDGPRAAIWIRGGYNDTSEQVYAYGNSVSYAKIANMMQDSGDEGAIVGAFTQSGGIRTNTNTYSQITIDNTQAHASMTDIGPAGVFLDGQGTGFTFSNVWVTNAPSFLFRNDSGVDPTLVNTSFTTTGTSNPSFNSSLVDTANIGVTNTFPF